MRSTKKKTLNKFNVFFTSNSEDLKKCNIFIVTVPTPVNKNNKPDLFSIKKATQNVAKYLKKGDIVIYESTVYPGFTEEVLIPLIEKNKFQNKSRFLLWIFS